MNGRFDLGLWLDLAFWKRILETTVQWALSVLPSVLLVLVGGFVALRGVRFILGRVEAQMSRHGSGAADSGFTRRANTILGVLNSALKVTVWAMVLMLVLVQVGINVAPLIAGAGVVGLAVGFGAQELVRDVISGFFILLENHVRTGDVAIINGTGGLVETIGLRTMQLRDLSGVVHVFQNGKIETLANMTKEWSAMVFDVGVAYKEDTDEVVDTMKEVAEALRADEAYAAKILEPIEIFGVDAFADSAVVIKARLKTQPIEQWAVGREYRRRLKKAFDAKGIEIPFPQRTLHIPAPEALFGPGLARGGAPEPGAPSVTGA